MANVLLFEFSADTIVEMLDNAKQKIKKTRHEFMTVSMI